MTLILSAFNGELTACIDALHDRKKNKIPVGMNKDIYYTSGLTAEGKPVAAAIAGIGKINSFISTSTLISECRPDNIVFIGIAGAVDSALKIGDVVLSDSITQYDMDYLEEKVIAGGIPGPADKVISTDKKLTAELAAAVGVLQGRGVFQRTLITGCTGSADIYLTPELHKVYSDVFIRREVLAVDMEGFTSAAAARMSRIPFAQIRIISDEADGTKPDVSAFREFMRSTSADLALIIAELLS